MEKPTCSASDCENLARSGKAEYCEKHYYRLRRTGTLNALPWHKRGQCSIEGCNKPESHRLMCSMHASRTSRHGDPQVTHRPRQLGACNLPDCDRPKESNGMCELHARRTRTNGDPHTVLQGKPHEGAANHNWVGDAVGYEGWHARLRKEQGAAANQRCVDCGEQARDWSYNHDSPDERSSPDGPYALSADCYSPRCKRCHIIFDLNRA